MTQPFRLGFLTHIEGIGDPHRIYQDTLELFVAADQLGFDVGWIAEHHFRTHPGRLPSPFPFLAAVAQRTRRIRLGTAIVILPLQHPLRVAEDAAVVDLLSDGRLELGVGSGTEPGEFQAFGLELGQRRVLTSQALQTLLTTLRGEPLTADGLQLDPPAPTLVDRMWQGALSLDGVQYVAQQGMGLLLGRAAWRHEGATDLVQLPLAQAYRGAWQDRTTLPRIGLSRGVYPAADRKTALDGLREGVSRQIAIMVKQGTVPANLSLERYCEIMHIAYGHSEEVSNFLAADRVFPYASELILQLNPANPPVAQAIAMLEQIATEIAPSLGWRNQS